MRALGLHPSDIVNIDDVRRLPLLTREDAAAAGSTRESNSPPFPLVRKMTGGTTGQPLIFGYDRDSEDFRQAIKLRGWGWGGYLLGRPTLYYWGGSTGPAIPVGKRIKIQLDRRLKAETYIDCTQRDESRLRDVVRTIREKRPGQIICYTQAGVDLARFILANGLRTWKATIPVICGAERLSPTDREVLEQAFGPEVFETYGCREVMLVACECEEHDGMHTSMENLLVEIIVREANGKLRPAEPGELGEVVLTDLNNLGMPFIRYANGDLAVAHTPGQCACGRGLTRLASIEGRVADCLRDARGASVCGVLLSRIFTYSAALASSVRQWQAVQHADGAITVKVVCRDGDLSDRARMDLKKSLDQYLEGVPLRIESVAHIPAGANGKRRVVIAERSDRRSGAQSGSLGAFPETTPVIPRAQREHLRA
jgi:phenylacetate-CoA ligase